MDILLDKDHALYKDLTIEYWNSEKIMIGQVVNHREVWTYVTESSDVLEFCV